MFSLSTPAARVLTVSELTAQIKTVVEDKFDFVAVTGEISNAKLYPSGHWYFSLKDKNATLSAVCFKGSSQNLRFDLEDGLMVVAKGRLSVYPPRGAYQLTVTALEPVGIGAWQLAFEQLKQKLMDEGLLAPERKRPIPLLPRRIGVVTSAAGAALRDILTALRRRNPYVQVLISPAKVQGEGSAEDIARAIDQLQGIDDIDVIIVARGGGSIEDLWSFNTEAVARAVAGSRKPVISGVGHETDITICDLVADLRAPTPTAAAELVARGRVELLERWTNLRRRLTGAVEQRVATAAFRLQRLDPKHAIARHQERLAKLRLRLDRAKDRLIANVDGIVVRACHRQERATEKLTALSAHAVLARGFSILQAKDGQIVRNALAVSPGQELTARLARGRLTLRVETVEYE